MISRGKRDVSLFVKQFDYLLVEILLDYLGEFIAIRDAFPDES